MFIPFQFPNNRNRGQMQNKNSRTNRLPTAEPNSIMYPSDPNSTYPKEQDFISTFREATSLPKVIPVVNGETSTDLTEPDIAEYLRLNPKVGFLKMKVATARGAVPVYNAVISIYKAGGDKSYLIATETTDLDGLSIPIPLPAPDKTQSFNPENPRPYADYDIVVEHPEYKTIEFKSVPVFDGITSVQQVNLTAYKESNPPATINEGTTAPKE